jgi:UMF1 family MFS transporter
MLGKFAAIIGPPMVGWIVVVTGSHRISILSLLILFIAGGVLLMFVDDSRTSATPIGVAKPTST